MITTEEWLPAFEDLISIRSSSVEKAFLQDLRLNSEKGSTTLSALSDNYLSNILSTVSYKDGWALSVETYDALTGPFLVIRTTQPDYHGSGDTDLCVRSMIPPFEDAENFIRWVMWRLSRMEIHELQEAFTVAGELYVDPHRELGP